MAGLCSKCRVVLTSDNCSPSKLKLGWGYCRECSRKYDSRWSKSHPDRMREIRSACYEKYIQNRRAAKNKYNALHKEEKRLYDIKHRSTPRGRHNQVREALRKEKASSSDALWSLNFYSELIKDAECHYCLGPLNPSSHALDRMDNNQSHVCWNVVPSCWWCNERKKADLSYDEMMLLAPALREIRKRREAVNVDSKLSGL